MEKEQQERPADFEKLPKRFQSYIRELESLVSALRKNEPSSEPTRIYIKRFVGGVKDEKGYLPNDSRIRFQIGPASNDTVECYIEPNEPNRLRIYGGEWLGLLPESGNTASVVLIRNEPVVTFQGKKQKEK